MGTFDPYHKWLGIPPAEQPPHHYRLLAITVFESDVDLIEMAADRQMAFLKQCSTGPHVAQSQELLNEIAAARLCLLRADSKAAYDAALKGKLAKGGTNFRNGRRKQRLWGVGGGIGGGLVLIAWLVMSFRSSDESSATTLDLRSRSGPQPVLSRTLTTKDASLQAQAKASSKLPVPVGGQVEKSALTKGDLPNDVSKTESRSEIPSALLGKWDVQIAGLNYRTVWTFEADGVVRSTQGAVRSGTWRLEKEKQRIFIAWGREDLWDSLNLPINPETTYGETCHNRTFKVVAVRAK